MRHLTLRIIPVIDILNGFAVHAVRGRRKEYRPLKSDLTNSFRPIDVALAFKASGFPELYIADLDAIMCKGENLAIIDEIAERTRLQLMVDAGISSLAQTEKVLQHKVSTAVIGTETLADLNFVKEAVDRFTSERIVVSLDLKGGKVLSKSRRLLSMTPLKLAFELEGMGISKLIVLDLARVGSDEGVDFDLLKGLLGVLKVKVLVGGGVRHVDDLLALRKLGVDGTLLATSLHSGKVSVDELMQLKLL
jgi:phosphoribosylformimino-5-aminoimidazole carboxamide ribotide isomerase